MVSINTDFGFSSGSSHNRITHYFSTNMGQEFPVIGTHRVLKEGFCEDHFTLPPASSRFSTNILNDMPGIDPIGDSYSNFRLKKHMKNETQERKQVFGKTVTITKPSNLYYLSVSAIADAQRMLEQLENEGYINKQPVFNDSTTKQVLEELLMETIINATEAVAKRWQPSGYVGAAIGVQAFTENENLWIQIFDNGDGFKKDILPKVGRESLSSRSHGQLKDPFIDDSMEDHLLKMGQLIISLDWGLKIENRKDSEGASVSIVIPLPSQK